MFLLCSGISCATPQAIDCGPPEILIKEQMVDIPADLLLIHEQATIKDHGDVSVLMDYALSCAAINRKYKTQIEALKALD